MRTSPFPRRGASTGRARAAAFTALALLGALACADGPSQPEEDVGPATRIEMDPAAVILESIGDSATLRVVLRDAAGRIVPGTADRWSVDSARVLAVGEEGIVVARSPGVAVVSARASAAPGITLTATARVTVAPRARSWRLEPGADTVGVGGQLRLSVVALDARGTPTAPPAQITWATSDAGAASVDASGLLTGEAIGRATVTATFSEASVTARIVVARPSGIRVSTGPITSCALSPAGEAYCWGFNDQGQLGTRVSPDRCQAGPVTGSYPCALAPQKVEGGLAFRSITNGGEHTCALDTEGRAYCWGANDRGQLGTGDAASHCVAAVFGDEGPCSYSPLPVATEVRFLSIGAGYRTTCALATDARVLCWGNNEQGSIGIPMVNDPTVGRPTEVAGSFHFRSLSVSWLHACAITTAGATLCWGHNSSGQLGNGDFQPQFAPTPIRDDRGFALVSAGKEHSCAFEAGQGAFCWGNPVGVVAPTPSGPYWESAPNPTEDRTPPDTLVSGAAFSCGLYERWARCWGSNADFKLGSSQYPSSRTPVPIAVPATFEMISAGFSHACGVRTGGAVFCWGNGVEGALGDGRPHEYGLPEDSSLPVRVLLPFR